MKRIRVLAVLAAACAAFLPAWHRTRTRRLPSRPRWSLRSGAILKCWLRSEEQEELKGKIKEVRSGSFPAGHFSGVRSSDARSQHPQQLQF